MQKRHSLIFRLSKIHFESSFNKSYIPKLGLWLMFIAAIYVYEGYINQKTRLVQ